MIFLIDHTSKPKQVLVYEDVDDVIKRIEWQDLLDKRWALLDSNGNCYEWDESKVSERGFVYDYTMKVVGSNIDLALKCQQTYERLNRPTEFLLQD